MQNSVRKIKFGALRAALVVMGVVLVSCSVKFSFTGASIPPDVKTVKVDYIVNLAAMVAPMLSPTLTDELTMMIQRQTRLEFVNEDPDVLFEGQIIDYRSEPITIGGDSQYAETNRLTVAIRMTCTNTKYPELSYANKTFTAYADYPSDQMLNSAESGLIPEICRQLAEDIFNAAFSQW